METEVKQKGSIIEQTMLLRLNFRLHGNSKKVSSAVVCPGANAKLLKVQKTLLESKELDAIRSADANFKKSIGFLCLPYDDMGIRLVPKTNVAKAYNMIVNYRDNDRPVLIDTFITAYPSLCELAKEKLQLLADELNVMFEELYNPADYPPVEEVKAAFGFDYDIFELSVPDELKIAGKYEEATKDLESKIAVVSDEITIVMRQALLDLVNHLKEMLEPREDGKKKRLHETAVSSIQDFLTSFSARNITNDVELAAVVARVHDLTKDVDVAAMRKDDAFKSTLHDNMETIAGELTKLVEVVPGRKFRTVTPEPSEEVLV